MGAPHIDPQAAPNGSGAAAVLSAGAGAFALAVLAIAADHILSFRGLMLFYKPAGPLSGVTTSAIAIWLALWIILDIRWRKRDVAIGPISAAALTLLVFALLLTFPPIGDLF